MTTNWASENTRSYIKRGCPEKRTTRKARKTSRKSTNNSSSSARMQKLVQRKHKWSTHNSVHKENQPSYTNSETGRQREENTFIHEQNRIRASHRGRTYKTKRSM